MAFFLLLLICFFNLLVYTFLIWLDLKYKRHLRQWKLNGVSKNNYLILWHKGLDPQGIQYLTVVQFKHREIILCTDIIARLHGIFRGIYGLVTEHLIEKHCWSLIANNTSILIIINHYYLKCMDMIYSVIK